jgi:hypothetical protein
MVRTYIYLRTYDNQRGVLVKTDCEWLMGGFACPILTGPVLELENLEFIT